MTREKTVVWKRVWARGKSEFKVTGIGGGLRVQSGECMSKITIRWGQRGNGHQRMQDWNEQKTKWEGEPLTLPRTKWSHLSFLKDYEVGSVWSDWVWGSRVKLRLERLQQLLWDNGNLELQKRQWKGLNSTCIVTVMPFWYSTVFTWYHKTSPYLEIYLFVLLQTTRSFDIDMNTLACFSSLG